MSHNSVKRKIISAGGLADLITPRFRANNTKLPHNKIDDYQTRNTGYLLERWRKIIAAGG